MFAKLHVPMPSCRDMKIPLHLVPFQTPINPTSSRLTLHPRRPAKFPPPLPQRQHIMHMHSLLIPVQRPHLPSMQPMDALRIDPLLPVRRIPLQHVACEDAIARRILNVDVQVAASHGYHDIEIDLQLVRDALFHAEIVRLVALPPAVQFGEKEEQADGEQEGGDLAAAPGGERVRWFGFGCGQSVSVVGLRRRRRGRAK